jgi:hypothetical protein
MRIGIVLVLAGVVLTAIPAEAQKCNRMELAALQSCIRFGGAVTIPAAGFDWENHCGRQLRLRYAPKPGQFTTAIPAQSRATVPCRDCGEIQSWSVFCE